MCKNEVKEFKFGLLKKDFIKKVIFGLGFEDGKVSDMGQMTEISKIRKRLT